MIVPTKNLLENRKVIVIIGPTAVGKSRLAVDIAQNISGEIVSADSIQVYRGLNVGTAKPTEEEKKGIPHHLIDVVDADYSYSVAEFNENARKCIENILDKGKIPVVVGGSGLYINSLIYDMDFSGEGADIDYRNELFLLAEKHGNEYIYDILKSMDPASAEHVHPNNLKRVVRMIERVKGTVEEGGVRDFTESFMPTMQFVPLIIRLTMDREPLYQRIELRADEFVANGLVEEVRGLLDSGVKTDAISLLGIGYKEIVASINGEYDLDEAIYLIKRNSRRFGKRQDTWFKRIENAHIIDMTGENRYEKALDEAMMLTQEFLNEAQEA